MTRRQREARALHEREQNAKAHEALKTELEQTNEHADVVLERLKERAARLAAKSPRVRLVHAR